MQAPDLKKGTQTQLSRMFTGNCSLQIQPSLLAPTLILRMFWRKASDQNSIQMKYIVNLEAMVYCRYLLCSSEDAQQQNLNAFVKRWIYSTNKGYFVVDSWITLLRFCKISVIRKQQLKQYNYYCMSKTVRAPDQTVDRVNDISKGFFSLRRRCLSCETFKAARSKERWQHLPLVKEWT